MTNVIKGRRDKGKMREGKTNRNEQMKKDRKLSNNENERNQVEIERITKRRQRKRIEYVWKATIIGEEVGQSDVCLACYLEQ